MIGDEDVVGEVDSEPLCIFRLSSFNLGFYGSLISMQSGARSHVK